MMIHLKGNKIRVHIRVPQCCQKQKNGISKQSERIVLENEKVFRFCSGRNI